MSSRKDVKLLAVKPQWRALALFMGSIWLSLTIVFEFIAGHYVFGNSWEKLLADYNFFLLIIWSLVLLTIFLAAEIINRFDKGQKLRASTKHVLLWRVVRLFGVCQVSEM